jgi:cation-transporting ATPase F
MSAPQWHYIGENEALDATGSSLTQGLSEAEASRRRVQYGPNAITRKKSTSPFILFLQQFNQPLIYILLAAAVISALLGELVDASVIFGVVLVNAIVSFIQESKAVKAMESLAGSMVSEATVFRGSVKRRIPSAELTVGRQGACRPAYAAGAGTAHR